MRISDWSSDVCSSDLRVDRHREVDNQPGGDAARRTEHGLAALDAVQRQRALRVGERGGAAGGDEGIAAAADQVGGKEVGVGSEIADDALDEEIGRASWRERVCQYV